MPISTEGQKLKLKEHIASVGAIASHIGSAQKRPSCKSQKLERSLQRDNNAMPRKIFVIFHSPALLLFCKMEVILSGFLQGDENVILE